MISKEISGSNKSEKIYNFLLAAIPIIGIYASFIPGISLGELVVIGMLLVCVMHGALLFKISKQEVIIVAYLIYAVIITLIAYMAGIYVFHWFNRLIRFGMYTAAAILISKKFFNTKLFFKYCYYISVAICASFILQYLIYYTTGTYLKLFGFMPLMAEGRMLIDYESIFGYSFFRPSSFFTEPSHASQYLIIPFTYYLFNDSESKKLRIAAVTVSGAAIILSTSLWGYILLLFDLIFWYGIRLAKTKQAKWLMLLPAFALCIIGLTRFSIFQDSFSRIDMSDVSGSATFSGRFSGYAELFKNSISSIVFGNGFGNIGDMDYSNSVIYILSGTGVIGLVFWFFISFHKLFGKNELWAKVLFCCFFMLLFGSSIILSLSFVLIFTAISETRSEFELEGDNNDTLFGTD